MIGLIIPVAQIMILMTRMTAQIYNNTREVKKTRRGLRPRPGCVFCTSPGVFACLGYHPSHQDDNHPNHPRLMPKPGQGGACKLACSLKQHRGLWRWQRNGITASMHQHQNQGNSIDLPPCEILRQLKRSIVSQITCLIPGREGLIQSQGGAQFFIDFN